MVEIFNCDSYLFFSLDGKLQYHDKVYNASAGPVPSNCLHCICIVESGCKMPNPVCRMDVGTLSCGPYQIKEDYWSDARQKGGDLDGGKFTLVN